MTTVTFDTLKFVEILKTSGFNEAQARGMANAIQEVQKTSLDELATKRDMDRLDARIDRLEAKLSRDMALIRWMLGLLLGGITAIVLKTFFV
ncbi:MAG: DUF1640 domain-containing protein [Magnetococcales bacterium]|nr:DUF1640 domain-containing protein [Magnetococcales bacterium]